MRLGRGVGEPIVYLDYTCMPLSVAVDICEFMKDRGFLGNGEYLINKAMEIKTISILKDYMNDMLTTIISRGRNELTYRNKTNYIWGN